jgi:hypothetical protein
MSNKLKLSGGFPEKQLRTDLKRLNNLFATRPGGFAGAFVGILMELRAEIGDERFARLCSRTDLAPTCTGGIEIPPEIAEAIGPSTLGAMIDPKHAAALDALPADPSQVMTPEETLAACGPKGYADMIIQMFANSSHIVRH